MRIVEHENVKKSAGCWLWTGYINPAGYGYHKGKRVHRTSYEQEVGPIPDGLWICHHCDVRNCLRPNHLYAGTAKQNNDDIWRRKGHYLGKKTHCKRGHILDKIRKNGGGEKGRRYCSECKKIVAKKRAKKSYEYQKAWRARKREAQQFHLTMEKSQ